MEVTITHSVSKCRDCPHVTNSSREHDCAFTSEPYPTRWWCKHPQHAKSSRLVNADAIPEHCPIKIESAAAEKAKARPC